MLKIMMHTQWSHRSGKIALHLQLFKLLFLKGSYFWSEKRLQELAFSCLRRCETESAGPCARKMLLSFLYECTVRFLCKEDGACSAADWCFPFCLACVCASQAPASVSARRRWRCALFVCLLALTLALDLFNRCFGRWSPERSPSKDWKGYKWPGSWWRRTR